MKRNYPLVLIAVGFFLVLFPFNLVGADQLGSISLLLHGFVAVLIMGFVLYYKQRSKYSAKTRKIVKLAALAIPLFFVASVIFGIALGIGNILYVSSLEPTKNLDRDLFEKEILDWTNTHRTQYGVGGVVLDPTLNDLAEIRSTNLSVAYPAYIEAYSDIDINVIAEREEIKCIVNGTSVPIHDYTILVPSKSYSEMEKVVDLIMTYMVDDEGYGNIIFGSNITKTGIDTFVVGGDLFVVQNFC
ncbi:MAG: hypothetical protein K5798_02695 [Nitrosopumilus sp.]|uniref:hypothetical protein n=1 Tax=Nitrosopumilus sp. TaxID=2024843 RepID=UPI00242A35F8|nr:hypothetical protein [Nitrosopumilus sp.]MCV0366158.1 hypothetical protein [Nitrosopumilus sp.]